MTSCTLVYLVHACMSCNASDAMGSIYVELDRWLDWIASHCRQDLKSEQRWDVCCWIMDNLYIRAYRQSLNDVNNTAPSNDDVLVYHLVQKHECNANNAHTAFT